jgi:[ribosomal protein S5]-alanine N-acetyltransferase
MKHNQFPKLETKNYLLRGISLKDAHSLFLIMNDAETMKFITPHPIQTIEEMKIKIKEHLIHFQKEKEIPWVVIKKSNNEVIGMFRFHKLHLWHKKAEMGVVLHKDYQQKGVMTEVIREILPFGFYVLGLNRIVGDIFEENEGSRRLLKKFGFRKEGTLRQTDFDGERYHNTVVYSILKDEYILKKGE